MKRKHCLNFIKLPIVAIALVAGTAIAGTETVAPAPMAPAEDDCISAVLTLAGNSHFISYGQDKWADGSSLSQLGFNPSLEFTFKLPENFELTAGTWWDVNNKSTPGRTNAPLGAKIQEIDLWTGLAWTYDKFTIGGTYQAWMYDGATEQIGDLRVSYDCLLSPSLTWHNRFTEGSSGGDTGSLLVLGLSHTFELGPVSISTPVNFAYALTDNYYVNSTPFTPGSDSGYAYTSVGVQGAYPLEFLGDCYGEWSLIAGVNYYWTAGSIIQQNPTNKFLTYNFGVSATF